MCTERQLAVDDDAEVACWIDDRHLGRQQLHVSDRDLVQLLASAQLYDLRLGWIQTQSAGLHPVVDVVNACCEADNGGGGVVGWRTDVHLAVDSINVQTESMTSDDVEQLRSVQDVQQRSQNAALSDAEQYNTI